MSRRTGSAWMISPRELGLRMKTLTGAGLASAAQRAVTLRMRRSGLPSLAQGKSIGQPLGQTGFHDFPLRLHDVIVQPAKFNGAFVQIVENVAGFRIAVPG